MLFILLKKTSKIPHQNKMFKTLAMTGSMTLGQLSCALMSMVSVTIKEQVNAQCLGCHLDVYWYLSETLVSLGPC